MADEIFRRPLIDAFDIILRPALNRMRAQSERDRVSKLIDETARYRLAEVRLHDAQWAFENGNSAALDETIIPPTPELLRSGEFERFEADTIEGTVRVAATVRRVLLGQIVRLYRRGVIDEDQFKAIRWYKETYERTGLTGNIPSTDYGKEIFASPHARLAFSESQSQAQSEIRFVREAMTKRHLKFFDAVVLDDIPLRRAKSYIRCRLSDLSVRFRDVAVELTAAYKELKK